MTTMNWDKARKALPSINNDATWDDRNRVRSSKDSRPDYERKLDALMTVAEKIRATNPGLTDEQVYQRAETWIRKKRISDDLVRRKQF